MEIPFESIGSRESDRKATDFAVASEQLRDRLSRVDVLGFRPIRQVFVESLADPTVTWVANRDEVSQVIALARETFPTLLKRGGVFDLRSDILTALAGRKDESAIAAFLAPLEGLSLAEFEKVTWFMHDGDKATLFAETWRESARAAYRVSTGTKFLMVDTPRRFRI